MERKDCGNEDDLKPVESSQGSSSDTDVRASILERRFRQEETVTSTALPDYAALADAGGYKQNPTLASGEGRDDPGSGEADPQKSSAANESFNNSEHTTPEHTTPTDEDARQQSTTSTDGEDAADLKDSKQVSKTEHDVTDSTSRQKTSAEPRTLTCTRESEATTVPEDPEAANPPRSVTITALSESEGCAKESICPPNSMTEGSETAQDDLAAFSNMASVGSRSPTITDGPASGISHLPCGSTGDSAGPKGQVRHSPHSAGSPCSHPSDYNDFWLPEFRHVPRMPSVSGRSENEDSLTSHAMKPEEKVWHEHLPRKMHVQIIDGRGKPAYPWCDCPACTIINESVIFTAARTKCQKKTKKKVPNKKTAEQEFKERQEREQKARENELKAKFKNRMSFQRSTVRPPMSVLTQVSIVDRGRYGLTVLDRKRPWQRLHIEDCLNPRPVARRLPEMDLPETVVTLYCDKRHRPGKIIMAQPDNPYGKRTQQIQLGNDIKPEISAVRVLVAAGRPDA